MANKKEKTSDKPAPKKKTASNVTLLKRPKGMCKVMFMQLSPWLKEEKGQKEQPSQP